MIIWKLSLYLNSSTFLYGTPYKNNTVLIFGDESELQYLISAGSVKYFNICMLQFDFIYLAEFQ